MSQSPTGSSAKGSKSSGSVNSSSQDIQSKDIHASPTENKPARLRSVTEPATESATEPEPKLIPCLNPGTGEQFDSVPMTTPAEVVAARQALGRAFPIWRQKPISERIRILRKFQKVLIDSLDEITAIINQDNGKSRQDALIEVFTTVDLLHQYCKKGPRWLARERVSPGLLLFKRCYVEYKPRGVVGVIAPWNYPFNLALAPALSALLAGNTVLLKPSEVTAATGKLLAALFARVPELAPFVRVLHGDSSVGEALVKANPDYIFLTGSTETGKNVLRMAADNLIPVGLELGGKDATIVLEDADLQGAAKWAVWGAFFNAGQTCMAVERVYVLESVYDLFVAQVVAETKRLQMGYSPDVISPNHLGPITLAKQMAIIEDHLAEAVAKGATILAGGRRKSAFFEPTVLVDVDHRMRIMQEETFGPLLPIMKVKDEAEAIRLANDSHYGLGGTIWSANIARAERIAAQLQTASVLINDSIVQFGIPALPFGGIKHSGTGRTHGQAGLRAFTESYAYVVGQPPFPFDIATILREPGRYHTNAALLRLLRGASVKQKLHPLLEASPAPPFKIARKVIAGLIAAGLTWRLLRRIWRK